MGVGVRKRGSQVRPLVFGRFSPPTTSTTRHKVEAKQCEIRLTHRGAHVATFMTEMGTAIWQNCKNGRCYEGQIQSKMLTVLCVVGVPSLRHLGAGTRSGRSRYCPRATHSIAIPTIAHRYRYVEMTRQGIETKAREHGGKLEREKLLVGIRIKQEWQRDIREGSMQ